MNTVISISGVSKSYKKKEVLHDLNLNIEKGHICGLIGPNGAGKTTLMKLLAGVIFPSSGELSFFESSELEVQRSRMSFMIENPIVDCNMNAYDNLAYIRYLHGYPDEKRIGEVLKIVGLSDTGKKKVKNFSLGMRQRLGIGMALLAKPEVLVLDEPVNGLDPEGIVEVRHLLKKLSEDYEVTILISSHLLSELSELCTDFTIINQGKLIASFSSDEMKENCRNHICLRTTDIQKTVVLLEEKFSLNDYKVLHNEEIHIFEHLDSIEHISKTITDNGLVITRLYTEGQNLEEYYLEKVGDHNE